MISYGIYVYHYFAPAAMRWIGTRLGEEADQHRALVLLTYTLFTLTLSVCSWHFFELPINRLKARFPYLQAWTRSAHVPAMPADRRTI
jgi:peptidoglycan/LPS O-acetylase OafA/YrhL